MPSAEGSLTSPSISVFVILLSPARRSTLKNEPGADPYFERSGLRWKFDKFKSKHIILKCFQIINSVLKTT